ncbi:MAG: hypothetical protein M1829_004810 [Trizodia sp. TS-e1964]|nr:MAG: hypothetical protein M1829_004810 [Trizodia sp. TS-e1964]
MAKPKSRRAKVPRVHRRTAACRSVETTSTQLHPKGRSYLEDIPTELLNDIFIRSMNCSLPLVSKTMLYALSSGTNQAKVGIKMLATDDPQVHTEVLEKRFMTSSMYYSLTEQLYNERPDHYSRHSRTFSHPKGTRPPTRLFHNILEENPQPLEFWKIRFLRCLYRRGVSFRWNAKIHAAAQLGIEEAVAAGNVDALTFFVWSPMGNKSYANVTPQIVARALYVTANVNDIGLVIKLAQAIISQNPRDHALQASTFQQVNDWLKRVQHPGSALVDEEWTDFKRVDRFIYEWGRIIDDQGDRHYPNKFTRVLRM